MDKSKILLCIKELNPCSTEGYLDQVYVDNHRR